MIKQGQKVTPRMKAMCLSKTKHTTKLSAQYALDAMVRIKNSGRLSIYTCEYCGGLHIGKSNLKNQRHEQTDISNDNSDSGTDPDSNPATE